MKQKTGKGNIQDTISKMKRLVLNVLAGAVLLPSIAFAGVIDDAQRDYQWRLSLVAEQSQRLDMWYAANEGKEITEGQLTYLKSLTDEFVSREDAVIDSGRKYKKALIEHMDQYKREWVLAEIDRIEKNEEISNRDKSIVLANYKLKEDTYKVLKEYEEKPSTKPKGAIQEITLGSLDETRTVGYNEYLVYSFSGTRSVSVNVSLEVINGNSVDVFLLDSGKFTNYQSTMLGGGSESFDSFAAGQGKNVKSKSYAWELPQTDRYFIVIDNTVQPAEGAKPTGQVDVRIKIAREEPFNSKSTPGFEAVYSIMVLAVFFPFIQKRLKSTLKK